jgi:GntR family transcriptional repressor for pyruvate dehydrogenase complex
MTLELTPISLARSEGLPQEIAKLLLNSLLSGTFAPGTRLPSERQLAQQLGVARSAVREALKSLGLLGLIEVRQGDGTYVRRPDSQLLPRVIEWGLLLGERRTADLVEMRQHLEIAVAGMAAQRRDAEDVAALRAALTSMHDAEGDPAAFVAADVAFHGLVAAAARNEAMREVLRGVQSLLEVWIRRVVVNSGAGGPSYDEHVAIFDAIVAGNPDGAIAAMGAHMSGAAKRLQRTLGARDESIRKQGT